MPDPSHVLVVAPNWLGDAVMALPAISDLRARYPQARLTVVARRSVAGVFELTPAVDVVVPLDLTKRWWRLGVFGDAAGRLRALDADLAVLLPNSFASAALAWLARIPVRTGYAWDGRSPLLTCPVPVPRESMHQSAYYRRLVQAFLQVGVATVARPTESLLEVPARARAAARSLLGQAGWDGFADVVVIAPGAGKGTAKRWTPDHAADLAARLAGEGRATCVLVGSVDDRALTASVCEVAGAGVIDMAGRTSLQELAGVFSLARVVVANDSGAMHLAAALGTPVVALFGPTDERRYTPLVYAPTLQGGQLQVLTEDVDCRPCMLSTCPIDHRCMTRLMPERVFNAVTVVRQGRAAG